MYPFVSSIGICLSFRDKILSARIFFVGTVDSQTTAIEEEFESRDLVLGGGWRFD